MILRDAGADVQYAVNSPAFDLNDLKLDINVELEIVDQDDEEHPPEVLIRLSNLPLGDGASTLEVHDTHDWDDGDYDDRPHAFVYSGFHHEHVSAWVKVVSHDEGQMVADITIVTDDVEYYDENAADNVIRGRCELIRQPRSEMWGP